MDKNKFIGVCKVGEKGQMHRTRLGIPESQLTVS